MARLRLEQAQLLIEYCLLIDPNCSFLDANNMITKFVDSKVVTKQGFNVSSTHEIKWKEELTEKELVEIKTKPIKPEKCKYLWERKETYVDGYRFPQPEEYVDGKTYSEYPLDSYIRKNWRIIEYQNKNYDKKLSEYKDLMKSYKVNNERLKLCLN